MKDFKEYLEKKLRAQPNIIGQAELKPPEQTNALQSSSALSVLDLLGEGPIEGLVTPNGKYAKGLSEFESLYLNKTPVKAPENLNANSQKLPFSKIKDVDRLTTGSISRILDNIKSRLTSAIASSTAPNAYLATKKKEDIDAYKPQLVDYISQNSGLARFGIAEYDINGIFNDSQYAGLPVDHNAISGRISTNRGDDVVNPYLTTVFDFQNLLFQGSGNSIPGTPIKRQIQINDRDTINVPEDFNFIAPVFNQSQTRELRKTGQINNLTKVTDFVGGGAFFFHIGDVDTIHPVSGASDTTENKLSFNTGIFFVKKDDDDLILPTNGGGSAIASGTTGEHDVFVFDNDGISLESASTNQISPVKGLTDGAELKIGFVSDLNSKYNYSNVSFDFRNGEEQQPVTDGYQQGSQDFQARQILLGPLKYGGKATGINDDNATDPGATGSEGGYADNRNAGDFSAWMASQPLQHDSYGYRHIIRRMEVDQCYPSISIDSLFDTLDAGDDAGIQRPATLDLHIQYGFEGDISESGEIGNDTIGSSVGALLSGGNDIKNIALSQFRERLNKQYTSLIQSSYMSTIDELEDLPKNTELKNLKIDQVSVPGLTDDLVTEFNLATGEYLFPGNSWRDVNRYVEINKLSHETDSTLIRRDVSISYFTETTKQNFIYPFSAIAGSTFDARTFSSQPSREFDVRLKKVLIPSNYQPLNTDGSDKRFVDNSNLYGKRDIYKWTLGDVARASKRIYLGDDNFEVRVKVKFGTIFFGSGDDDGSQYVYDTFDPSSTTNANRLALIQRGENTTDAMIIIFSPTGGDVKVKIGESNLNSIIYDIRVKRTGGNNMLIVVRNFETGEIIGSNTDTGWTTSYDMDPGNQNNFQIGAYTNGFNSRITANSKIVDLKIYRNNQLINWYDGTVIQTIRLGTALKDKIGGAHAGLIIASNTYGLGTVETDSSFEFGKNKEVLYNGDWDGTFKLGWTDNPAWILYDLMINPVYGVGNNLDDREDVNIFKLYEIGRFCDAVDSDGLYDGVLDSSLGLEPRFSANIRLTASANAFEILGNIASIFRAISFWDGASLTFNADKPKELAAIFNNGNVFDGVFNYGDITSSARFTRVEVPYSDAKDQFVTKYEYIEDEERIRQYGIVTNKANGIGCTSKSQARRLGKYIMLSNKLETELVNFKAGREALFLEPGDIIRIDDEVKNFEINYGRILEIETGKPNSTPPYFIIEDQINTGSILTGEQNGGLYAYNNKKQTELHTLYDVVNYDRVQVFGIDQDKYTGRLPISEIENSDAEQISKFYLTGVLKENNGIKVFLNSGDSNFKDITGVQVGSYFNVELNNQVTGEFKIVKISAEEDNLFNIDALQYERRKFNMIEDEDFDLEENTYNIGIPKHEINRPTAPVFNFEIFQNNNLTYSITGDINSVGDGIETSYRVTVLKTNRSSPYFQKEVQKDTTEASDGAGTPFRINGLMDGNYSINIAALKNPESVMGNPKTFSISPPTQRYIKPLIRKIDGDVIFGQVRVDGTGYGSGQSLSNDCSYFINSVDEYARNLDLSTLSFSVNVYAKTGDNYNMVAENHKQNQYTFTEVQNRLTYGQMNTGFDLRFDLIQNEDVVDTSFYKTTIT